MTTWVILALALPLLGFLYCALLGWRMGRAGSGVVASAAVGASFVAGLLVAAGMAVLPESERFVTITVANWITAGSFTAPIAFLVDPLSTVMLLVVTGVGFLIHVYATGYMRDHHGHLDPGYNRFFAFLNLFVFSMLVLVLANNFVLLMVGWGGVGVCSYFLIAFWFDKPENARAGSKAFIVNAIGDVGLLLACFLLFWTFRRVDFDGVFREVAAGQGSGAMTTIAFLLLIAAAAKSAQFPLHVWLPDAMAGPTPVSALIHAATMVTAGVYLIARTHPIYEHAPLAMAAVASIGAVTAFFAATIALTQTNLKRVVAYSTLSQLGYMFVGVGVGAFGASIFHLTTHAFFKAVLFLAAGIVIHHLAGEEDMRQMGGLRSRLPVVYWCFAIAAAANAGFPLLSGFFSKDEIVSAAFLSPQGSVILGGLLLLTSAITGVYMFRAVSLTFHGTSNAHDHGGDHGVAGSMLWPVVILTVLAVVAGFPYAQFGAFLHPSLTHWGGHPVEVANPVGSIAIASGVVSVAGIALGLWLYAGDRAIPRRLGRSLGGLAEAMRAGYYIDAFYGAVILAPVRVIALISSGPLDNFLIGGIVSLFPAFARWMGSEFRHTFQTGYVRHYAAAIFAGAALIAIFFVYRIGI